MICFAPIHESIRKTLSQKTKAVSRNFGGKDPLASIEGEVGLQDTYSKAVWVRVFSPVDSTAVQVEKELSDSEKAEYKKQNPDKEIPNKLEMESGGQGGMVTATMIGGTVEKDGTMFHGFKDLYWQGDEGGGPLAPKSKEGVKTLRPIAGVKDVTVNYKGGLSAIREATINWTCWSFEDLEKLTPHFMAHGKGVLVEWGWSIPEVEKQLNFGTEDMLNGQAYSTIQNRVVELGGNYDAMAGIITNWEWSLRDDGGFDCVTKIVSRGVNVIDKDMSGTGQAGTTSTETETEPTISEFVSALKEGIMGLCAEGDSWTSMGDEYPGGPVNTHNWSPDNKTQPPGTLYKKFDNIWKNVRGGPWVTWGFFEDNILSKFVGRSDAAGKVINSFRSIEPVLFPHKGGTPKNKKEEMGLYMNNSGKPTPNIHEARFQSVKIRNSKWLITPFMGRWILPGQFPVDGTLSNSWFLPDYELQLTDGVGKAVNNTGRFRNFAVNESDWGEGGYLRNILISYELIESSFESANTLREGCQALFSELSKDVDGFWKFEVVVDAQLDGNVKVIDSNETAAGFDTVSLLNESDSAKNSNGNDEFGNPGSNLFIFPSWGEKSIVKSQTMSSKVPSSMAVSAMYAGSSKEGEEGDGAPLDAQAVAKLQGGTAKDKSQVGISSANRLGSGNPFGSKNPWGSLQPDMKSDGKKSTTIPSGVKDDGGFGPGHGVPFEKIGIDEIIELYRKKGEEEDDGADTQREKELAERKAVEGARSEEADNIFHKLHPNGLLPREKTITVQAPRTGFWSYFDSMDAEEVSLYNAEGDLNELPPWSLLIRRTMIDYLNGNGRRQKSIDEKIDKNRSVMVPIELEIVLDGTGGIIPGNCFHVDYIPENYKKYCVFQAMSADHTVSAEGWTTNIRGQIRIGLRKLIKDVSAGAL